MERHITSELPPAQVAPEVSALDRERTQDPRSEGRRRPRGHAGRGGAALRAPGFAGTRLSGEGTAACRPPRQGRAAPGAHGPGRAARSLGLQRWVSRTCNHGGRGPSRAPCRAGLAGERAGWADPSVCPQDSGLLRLGPARTQGDRRAPDQASPTAPPGLRGCVWTDDPEVRFPAGRGADRVAGSAAGAPRRSRMLSQHACFPPSPFRSEINYF